MTGIIKTKKEIQAMREGGKILADILARLKEKAVVGTTTAFLDIEARRLIREHGAEPSFLNYRPVWDREAKAYPAALCTSVNDEIVHALPSKRALREGDIVGLDLGLWYGGACVDAALTVGVGNISTQTKKLLEKTEQALYEGIAAVTHGAKTGDIGYAIGTYIAKNGFSVAKDLTGHGVGRAVHEEPAMYNFGKKGTGETLLAGMTLALEPMATIGVPETTLASDGWGVKTADGSLSAQFEHTILVTDAGCDILTQI